MSSFSAPMDAEMVDGIIPVRDPMVNLMPLALQSLVPAEDTVTNSVTTTKVSFFVFLHPSWPSANGVENRLEVECKVPYVGQETQEAHSSGSNPIIISVPLETKIEDISVEDARILELRTQDSETSSFEAAGKLIFDEFCQPSGSIGLSHALRVATARELEIPVEIIGNTKKIRLHYRYRMTVGINGVGGNSNSATNGKGPGEGHRHLLPESTRNTINADSDLTDWRTIEFTTTDPAPLAVRDAFVYPDPKVLAEIRSSQNALMQNGDGSNSIVASNRVQLAESFEFAFRFRVLRTLRRAISCMRNGTNGASNSLATKAVFLKNTAETLSRHLGSFIRHQKDDLGTVRACAFEVLADVAFRVLLKPKASLEMETNSSPRLSDKVNTGSEGASYSDSNHAVSGRLSPASSSFEEKQQIVRSHSDLVSEVMLILVLVAGGEFAMTSDQDASLFS